VGAVGPADAAVDLLVRNVVERPVSGGGGTGPTEGVGMFRETRVFVVAAVAALGLASSAVAGVRYGHFHGDVGKGANEQHVDLFVSPGVVRISYVLRVHCSDNSNLSLGDFSGLAITLKNNGDFSFKRALKGTFRQIAGNVSGSKAAVHIHVMDTILGAQCTGTTTFHARFIHA
jgi:hypothetical protein